MLRFSSIVPFAAAVLVVAGASASCGNSDDAASGAGAGKDGGGSTTGTPTPAPASGTIGAAGGIVASSDGTSVSIPAGALATAQSITVTPDSSAPLAASFVAVGTPYVFGPEGLTFASPATVTLDITPSLFPAGKTASDVQVYTAPVGTTAFTTLPTMVRDATHVTAPTMHFSIFVPGIVTTNAIGTSDGGGATGSSGGDGGSDGGATLLPDGGTVDTVPTPNETAGTRLHPVYKRTDFGDGAMTLSRISMYDEQRQEPCDATLLSDGNMYCAPTTVAATFFPTQYFADATCKTTPILGVASTATGTECATIKPTVPHYYLLTQDTATCGAVSHIWTAPDSARLPTGTIYYADSLGRCDAIAFDATQGEAYPTSALTELGAADLVRLTSSSSTATTGPGRLRGAPTVLTGSDGSRWSLDGQLVDTQTGSFCSLSWGTDKALRCTPSGEFYEWYAGAYYSDATCQTPEYDILASSTCSTDPRTSTKYASSGGSYDSDGCFVTDTVSIASNAPATKVYGGSPCAAVASTGTDTYYTGPAPTQVADSTFVTVTPTPKDSPAYGVNGSRIHAENVHDVGNDGSDVALLATEPVDTQSGNACTPLTLADGAVHCVPPTRSFLNGVGPTASTHYVDAACTQKVVSLVTPTFPICTRGVPAPLLIEGAGSTKAGCGMVNVYKNTGTALATSTPLYSNASGTCVADGTALDTTYLASDMTRADPSEFITESLSIETR